MQLEIITPEKLVYEGYIYLIRVPGTQGSFEVLQNHAPIISTLEEGLVKVIDDKNNVRYFDLTGGVIEVLDNKIVLLADEKTDVSKMELPSR